MVTETESRLVQVRVNDALVRAVDHWAVDQRLTRGQAFERLLRAGLAALQGEAG